MFRKATIALLATAALGIFAPDVVSARGGGGGGFHGGGGGFHGGFGGSFHRGGGFGRGGFHAARFSGRGFRGAAIGGGAEGPSFASRISTIQARTREPAAWRSA